MFAYCNNNPTMYVDATGRRPKQFPICLEFDDEYIEPIDYSLLDEEQEQENGFASHYNGVEVIEVPFLGDSAFSLGKIYVGKGVANHERLLAHEYGHCMQLSEVGMEKYPEFVAFPSVVSYCLLQMGILTYGDYYNLPWECYADMCGNAIRDHAAGAEESAKNYWDIIKSLDYPVIP